jgi:hypothetical protein
MSVTNVYIAKGTTTISGVVDENGVSFMDGSQTITGGVNLSGLTTGLAYVLFGPNFYGNIPASSPLRADVDFTDGGANAPVFEYGASGGSVAFYAGGGSSACTRTKHIGKGELTLMGGGTHASVEQALGRLNITADVIATSYRASGGESLIRYNSTAITNCLLSGGNKSTIMRTITNLDMAGGYLIVQPDDAGTNVPTCATARIYNGVLDWRAGNITSNLYVFGKDAVVDFSNITQNVTVAALHLDAAAYANPRNKWKGRKFNTTFSSVTVYGHNTDDSPT